MGLAECLYALRACVNCNLQRSLLTHKYWSACMYVLVSCPPKEMSTYRDKQSGRDSAHVCLYEWMNEYKHIGLYLLMFRKGSERRWIFDIYITKGLSGEVLRPLVVMWYNNRFSAPLAHYIWSSIAATYINPSKHFTLTIIMLSHYYIRCLRLHSLSHLQGWRHGVSWYFLSISLFKAENDSRIVSKAKNVLLHH